MTDIVMASGEASGDRLGASLAAELRRLRPSVRIAGIGGDAMRRAGVEILADFAPLAVMGYWDAARRLPQILSLRRRLLSEVLLRRRPKLFVGIDAPDFNLGVATRARAAGIKTAQYVSPSVWMWRGDRIHKIARAADAVWCLFPFEPAYYKNANVRAIFVGHPDAEAAPPDKVSARRELQISDDEKVIALMPGSRASELRHHLPLFAETIRLLQKPQRRFIAVAADSVAAKKMRAALPQTEVRTGAAAEVLRAADAALIKSGTSTLQAALAHSPMVVAYKTSFPAYCAARTRRFYLPFFALPNILCGRFVAPEMLQREATPKMLARQMQRILEDESCRAAQISAWSEIREQLSAAGGAKTAAKAALAML